MSVNQQEFLRLYNILHTPDHIVDGRWLDNAYPKVCAQHNPRALELFITKCIVYKERYNLSHPLYNDALQLLKDRYNMEYIRPSGLEHISPGADVFPIPQYSDMYN